MTGQLKDRIAAAFLTLIKQKNVDKISVKDLAKHCQISRQTFYYHYQDILEVVEWIFHRRMEDLLAKSLQCDSAEEAMTMFLDFSEDNRAFIQKLLSSKYHEIISRLLISSLKNFLQDFFRLKLPDTSISYSDMDMTLTFCTYGLLGLLLDHPAIDKEGSREKTTAQICRLLSRLLESPERS